LRPIKDLLPTNRWTDL